MNVKSVEKENGNAKIVVAIAKDTFENGLNKAYLKNRKHIAIPGFRKGHVPEKMARSHVNMQKAIHQDDSLLTFPHSG